MGERQVEKWYAEHGDALVRFAASQVGSSHADDVVAAAVLSVLRRGVVDVADGRAYLYRAVANASRKHWRSTSRRRQRDVLLVRTDVYEDRIGSCFSMSMVRALEALSAQQRAVVHLTYVEDLTPSMVAARLGVSEGTIRRQLARGRERLRKVLDEQG